ncbi:hypothetical protein D3C80_2063920 [compost metagenome]
MTVAMRLWYDFMGDHKDHGPGGQAKCDGVAQREATGNAQADKGAKGLHQARPDCNECRPQCRDPGHP